MKALKNLTNKIYFNIIIILYYYFIIII